MADFRTKAAVLKLGVSRLLGCVLLAGLSFALAIFVSKDIIYAYALVGCLGLILLLINKNWVLYAIILALYFEGYIFSVFMGGVRVRIVSIVEVAALCFMVIWLLMGKIRLKRTPLDVLLWSYLGINILAIINALWPQRSMKIASLLLSLVLLYYLIINLVTTRKIFVKTFNLLVYVGVAQILYGLYQVAAGMANHFLHFKLPIGHLGLIHKFYIGSPWGRPYGTFFEPDWYGAVCAFYALLFMALYYSRVPVRRKFYLKGLVLSLLGLLFSFVRAAWFGFIVGALIFLLLKYKERLVKLNLATYVKKVFLIIVLFVIVSAFCPPIRKIIKQRFFTQNLQAGISIKNIRFNLMKISFRAFLQHPLIGNGPGSASYNYLTVMKSRGHTAEMYNDYLESGGREGFDPSIITTVLGDTGLIGFIIFTLLIGKFIRYNLRKIPVLETEYSIIALGLFTGIIGLLMSYVFSQGFWLPFTWVFLALNMAVFNVGGADKKG